MSLVVNDEDLIYDDWFELRIQIGFYGSSWILNLNHMNDFPQNRGTNEICPVLEHGSRSLVMLRVGIFVKNTT